MKLSECEGKKIEIGRPLSREMEPHNKVTFEKLVKAIKENNGKLAFETLVSLAEGHESGDAKAPHPYQFVTYCLKSGWLHIKE
jgi:hypothetical protein